MAVSAFLFLPFSRSYLSPCFPCWSGLLLETPFLFITNILLHTQAIFIPERESGEGCDDKMLKKLLLKTKSKKKKEAASSALPTLDRLHEVFIFFPCPVYFVFCLSYSLDLCFLARISSVLLATWQARLDFGYGSSKHFKLVSIKKKKFLVSNEYIKNRKPQNCSVYHPSL
jgi:hypothetical protein